MIQTVTVDYTSIDSSLASRLYASLRHAITELQQILLYLFHIVKILLDPQFLSGDVETEEGAGGVGLNLTTVYQKYLKHFHEQRNISHNRINHGDFGLQQYAPPHHLEGGGGGGSYTRQIENSIISNIASLFTRIIEAKLMNSDEIFHLSAAPAPAANFKMESTLLGLVAGGGWPISLRIGSLVDLSPRALFLNTDSKALEQVIFPSSAIVHTSLSSGFYGRPCGVWVNECHGGFLRFSIDRESSSSLSSSSLLVPRDDGPPMSILVPRNEKSFLPATEMISPRDTHVPLDLSDLMPIFKHSPIGTSEHLSNLLKSLAQRGAVGGVGIGPSETKQHDDDITALSLTMFMAQMRCLLIQMTTLETIFSQEQKIQQTKLLIELLSENLMNVISIASLDPVNTVVDAFKAKITSGTSGQLDVLSNLLREGDLVFLERITLRIWRQFQPKPSSSASSSSSQTNTKPELTPGPTTLAGEVQIAGNRIRALSHFPSVRILPIHLEKMTGRWFYECSLLSDGLMQIGWADRSFRCDPVCGQGVGDHLHSWAIDGLRYQPLSLRSFPSLTYLSLPSL
jgi:hypothetical protein